jgi:anion-transporting  ArsA/GET3 family ATPase
MIQFRKHKVLVCAGSGGVGKTTIAAALGVAAAVEGLRVLVLTIDPAKRLATALGIGSGELNKPSLVPGQKFSGQLWASMVDPQTVFDNFIREAAPNKDVADKLLGNVLYKQLSTTLSGSQEFTSLELLLKAHQSGEYDLIILDTPPSQHAIDFLRAPEKIYSLFQKSITQWFMRSTEKTGFFVNILHKGTKLALDALEKVTGEGFIRELSGFFENMSELQKVVSERSLAVQKLLTGPDTSFVLVTATEPLKLREAELFHNDLKATGATLSYLVVNRAFPFWLVDVASEKVPHEHARTAEKLHEFFLNVQKYYRYMDEHILNLKNNIGGELIIYKVPELDADVVGLGGLRALADVIQLWKRSSNDAN